ncbi:MAG: hypothetical protein KKG99_09385 [Bacteroidetes bacterium]|nr:hypothetical protein [Bacteroidota bacterium]
MFSYYKIRRSIQKGYFLEIIKRRLNRLRLKLFHNNIYNYDRQISAGNYEKAFEIGKKELIKYKDDIYLTKKNAFLAHRSGNHEYAEVLMKKALVLFLNSDTNRLIQLSRIGLPANCGYDSGFKYFGGNTNFGFILHNKESANGSSYNYITKIMDSSGRMRSINKGIYFYLNIYEKYPKLKTICPNFLNSIEKVDSKYSLLTVKMIEGKISSINDISEILKINSIIETISYNEALPLIEIFGSSLDTQRLAAGELHTRMMNEHIFSEMKYLLNKSKNDHNELLEIIKNLERIIISKKLYRNIIPEIHYSFCHNDFHKSNIISEYESDKKWVIDWGAYGVALRGWDMNNYFWNFAFSFDEILKLYINKCDFCEGNNLIIAKIFFVYMQIYKWVLKLKGEESQDKLIKYFRPASIYIEELYNEFLKESRNLHE